MGRAARRGILAAALVADKPVCLPCDIRGDLWGVLILGASRQSATSGPVRPTDSVPFTSTMTRPQASHELAYTKAIVVTGLA